MKTQTSVFYLLAVGQRNSCIDFVSLRSNQLVETIIERIDSDYESCYSNNNSTGPASAAVLSVKEKICVCLARDEVCDVTLKTFAATQDLGLFDEPITSKERWLGIIFYLKANLPSGDRGRTKPCDVITISY